MHSAHRPNDILVSCPGPLLPLCLPICFCQLIQKLWRCEMCSFKSQKVIVLNNVSAYRSQLYWYLSCLGTQISTLPCQLITVSHCVTVDNLSPVLLASHQSLLMCSHKGNQHAQLMEADKHQQRITGEILITSLPLGINIKSIKLEATEENISAYWRKTVTCSF